MSILTYNVDDDFTEPDPNLSQLQDEINADNGVDETVLYITRVDDNIYITFDGTVSAGEITIVDGLVTAHEAATVVGNYVLGNNEEDTNVHLQFSNGLLITTQPLPTILPNASATLSISQLGTRILRMTPTLPRVLTFPTATNIIGTSLNTNDSFDFCIVNEAAAVNTITVQTNTGNTLIGNQIILADSSGCFRAIVTSGTTCLIVRM